MIKNILLLSILLTSFVFAQQTLKAQCVIDWNQSYNLVNGMINITFDGYMTTFDIMINDTNKLLAEMNNGFHIHQYGVDLLTTSCNETGKHYNPILNYGELSARTQFLPSSSGGNQSNGTNISTLNVMADWLQFYGEYSILSRSIVIHDNTTKRLGCCTIVLIDDGDNGTGSSGQQGFNKSILVARMKGVNISISHNDTTGDLQMNVSTSSELEDSQNNFTISKVPMDNMTCDSLESVYNGTSWFDNISNFTMISLENNGTNGTNGNNSINMDIGMFYGRYFRRIGSSNDTKSNYECAVLIQIYAQENVPGNDEYVNTTNTTTTTMTGTGQTTEMNTTMDTTTTTTQTGTETSNETSGTETSSTETSGTETDTQTDTETDTQTDTQTLTTTFTQSQPTITDSKTATGFAFNLVVPFLFLFGIFLA